MTDKRIPLLVFAALIVLAVGSYFIGQIYSANQRYASIHDRVENPVIDIDEYLPIDTYELFDEGIKSAVKDKLIDPQSAIFGPIKTYAKKNDLYACGTVNSKNSYGGYAGKSVYSIGITLGDSASSAKYGPPDFHESTVESLCGLMYLQIQLDKAG